MSLMVDCICGRCYTVPADLRGERIRCKTCHAPMTVGEASRRVLRVMCTRDPSRSQGRRIPNSEALKKLARHRRSSSRRRLPRVLAGAILLALVGGMGAFYLGMLPPLP